MRIIAGKYKKMNLFSLEGEDTRPTKDAVKEALFSSLGDIEESTFLDLFSGSGAIGIEALSRGASKVALNDANPLACKIIKKNLAKVNAKADVYNLDYKACLNQLKGERFDFVYLDPPYAFNDHQQVFELLIQNQLLKKAATIIWEVRKNTEIVCPESFEIYKTKNYGISQLNYYKEVDND